MCATYSNQILLRQGRQYTRSLEWALSKLPPSSLFLGSSKNQSFGLLQSVRCGSTCWIRETVYFGNMENVEWIGIKIPRWHQVLQGLRWTLEVCKEPTWTNLFFVNMSKASTKTRALKNAREHLKRIASRPCHFQKVLCWLRHWRPKVFTCDKRQNHIPYFPSTSTHILMSESTCAARGWLAGDCRVPQL